MRTSWKDRFAEQDLLSGAMFLVVGSAARYLSYDYPLGSLAAPGSGAFPMLLSYGLILIGLGLVVKSVFAQSAVASGWDIRALFAVTLAILAFEHLIDAGGLVVSMVSLIALTALAGREAKPRELVIFTVILVSLSVGLFVFGLGLPVKVLPWI